MQNAKRGQVALTQLHGELSKAVAQLRSQIQSVENPRVRALADDVDTCIVGHLEEIETLLESEYGASPYGPQLKSCGANGPGGKGFQSGNTCGRKVNVGGFIVRMDSLDDALDMLDDEHLSDLESFDSETESLESALDDKAANAIQSAKQTAENAEKGVYDKYQSKVIEVTDEAADKLRDIDDAIDEKLGRLDELEDGEVDPEFEPEIADEIQAALESEKDATYDVLKSTEQSEHDSVNAAYDALMEQHPDSVDEIADEQMRVGNAIIDRYESLSAFYYSGLSDKLDDAKPADTKWLATGHVPGSSFTAPNGQYLQADGESAAQARASKAVDARVAAVTTNEAGRRVAYEAERKERIAAVEKSKRDRLAKLAATYDAKVASIKEVQSQKTKAVEAKLAAAKATLTAKRNAKREKIVNAYYERYEAIQTEIDRLSSQP